MQYVEIGDVVEAGEGEDFDRGRVVALDVGDNGVPHTAYVNWDSGVSTPYPADALTVVGRRD